MANRLALLVAVAAVAWVAVLLAAPFVSSPLAAAVYALGSLICHQIPERSFHLNSFQLPVCARCTGLYSGAAVGAVWAGSTPRVMPFSATTRRSRVLMTVAAAIPTLITVALEQAAVWYPSNTARAVAGTPLGCAVAFVVLRALQHQDGPAQRPTLHYE